MAIDIKRYSEQLRHLCEDYYLQNISYIEFRMQRNDIFDKIQAEQGVVTSISSQVDDDLDGFDETDGGIEDISIYQD